VRRSGAIAPEDMRRAPTKSSRWSTRFLPAACGAAARSLANAGREPKHQSSTQQKPEEGKIRFPPGGFQKSNQSLAVQSSNMKGNPKVIAVLNEALKEELAAINQYFLHAEMCENWHYHKVAANIRKESIDEMKHAEAVIERILFLDGTPNMTSPMTLNIGQNVKEQLENDLKLEVSAIGMYNRGIEVARQEGDNATRELLEGILKDEERHLDWIEAQLHQIKEVGYERYLTQQMNGE
jgi:bacterioferritin